MESFLRGIGKQVLQIRKQLKRVSEGSVRGTESVDKPERAKSNTGQVGVRRPIRQKNTRKLGVAGKRQVQMANPQVAQDKKMAQQGLMTGV